MELKRDLLKREKKSLLRINLGILFVIIAILWIAFRIMGDMPIRTFDWLYSVVFSLNGVVYILNGYGVPIEKYFGEAFVLINEQQISIKPRIRLPEQKIDWESIKAVDYHLNKLRILYSDNSKMVLDLSDFDYSLKNDIKNTVYEIAKSKSIETGNE